MELEFVEESISCTADAYAVDAAAMLGVMVVVVLGAERVVVDVTRLTLAWFQEAAREWLRGASVGRVAETA